MDDFAGSCLGDGSSGDARGFLGDATTLHVENKGTLGSGEYRRDLGRIGEAKGDQEGDAYEIVGDTI
ncbi:unnamed protein product [Ilex paraguariensis]|uniref:Uncharacterized protein n=1 Tax=Ilex paraguariensis TaxID=185542 RepID=A0ABC8TC39_9AQUA